MTALRICPSMLLPLLLMAAGPCLALNFDKDKPGLKDLPLLSRYAGSSLYDKAQLRADSAPQLQEMAQALKANADLKVFIVGHTDSQGQFENNLVLSQKRAQAVADALAGKYGIAAARLLARGVANLASVASNDSEDGRARNRRVELVVR